MTTRSPANTQVPANFPRGRNKYGAVRTTVDGRTYASRAEAEAAVTLDLQRRAGLIRSIEYQPRFELLPGPNRITYVADFRVTWADGRDEVIDIKGYETDVFKLKRKMFRHFYPDLTLTVSGRIRAQ